MSRTFLLTLGRPAVVEAEAMRQAVVEYYGNGIPAFLREFLDARVHAIQRATEGPIPCSLCGWLGIPGGHSQLACVKADRDQWRASHRNLHEDWVDKKHRLEPTQLMAPGESISESGPASPPRGPAPPPLPGHSCSRCGARLDPQSLEGL